MGGGFRRRLCGVGLAAAGAATVFLVANRPVAAADQVHDEIQVYNAEIAGIGQWTYEQHLNFAAIGQTQPEFPGGFTSNHSLQGTPEFAYGITKWWEAGFYLPFAVNGSGEFLSDGAKIRSLFVVPDAAKRDFFYGINFELGYEPPQFSLSRWKLEIRPSSAYATRNGNSSSIRSWTRLRFKRRGGFRAGRAWRAISGTIGSLDWNIMPTSAGSAISCRYSSKASNCSPSRISK